MKIVEVSIPEKLRSAVKLREEFSEIGEVTVHTFKLLLKTHEQSINVIKLISL